MLTCSGDNFLDKHPSFLQAVDIEASEGGP